MKKSAEKYAQMHATLQKAVEIMERETITAEDYAEVERLQAEAEQYRSDAMQLEGLESKMNDIKSQHPAQEPDASEFKDLGEFLIQVYLAERGRGVDARLKGFKDEAAPGERKDLAESVGATGGFLVPTDFIAQ